MQLWWELIIPLQTQALLDWHQPLCAVSTPRQGAGTQGGYPGDALSPFL